MSADLPQVRTHTLLRGMGGTTAVARAVHQGLLDTGVHADFCYECDDNQGREGDIPAPPAQAGALAAESGAGLVHVHASTDWAACLGGLAGSGVKLVATLHDCRAFTGGCPYPLDCPHWETGCVPDCKRLYADADVVARNRREAFLRAAPVIVTPSRWMANLARKVWPDLKVRIIPNGVPWPARLPAKVEARRSAGVAPGARMVLFAAHGGVDAVYKQGRRFLKMFARIKQRVPEALCYVVGGERVERQGDVIFLPYVDGESMRRLMRAADVLAQPSLADNHPMVVLESMSMGLPVAAFGSGGIPEQFKDGEEGLLVRPGDWAALEKSVQRLLVDPALSRRLGEAAHANGVRRFSQERMVRDYLKLYARVAAE